MNRIRTSGDTQEFRELEIQSQDDKWFWAGWIATTAGIFVAGWRVFPSLTKFSLPLWMLWLIGFVVCQLRGWAAIIWSRNGKEVLKIYPDQVQYRTLGGVVFDRKNLSFPLEPNESPLVETLTFGLGAHAAQNRIHIKAARGDVYLGRGLSQEDTRTVHGIITEWLRPSVRFRKS